MQVKDLSHSKGNNKILRGQDFPSNIPGNNQNWDLFDSRMTRISNMAEEG